MAFSSHEALPDPPGLLVISGATGWVGRTAVHELQRRLPPALFARHVRLFASRAGSLVLPGSSGAAGEMLPVHPLSSLGDLAATEPIAAVLHAAFLTRDRLATLGQDTYVNTNRLITRQVADALRLSPSARVVVISSGAAAAHDHADDRAGGIAHDPYGVLKREEEQVLTDLAPGLVLRLYALSGRFIREPDRFALGDFLGTALRGEAIRVRSPRPVLRSYGHAGDITALAWRWLLDGASPPALPVAAVNLEIDLLSLAERIRELYDLPPVVADVTPDAPPDRYVADPQPFLEALARYGLSPSSLDQQLRDTAAGLMAASAGQDP